MDVKKKKNWTPKYFQLSLTTCHLPSTNIVSALLFKGTPKRRLKLARKRAKSANISIGMLRRAVLMIFIQQKYKFCFESELLKPQPYWFALYHWARKSSVLFAREEQKRVGSWRVIGPTLVPHLSVLFVTSYSQTARNKMAALTAVFSRPSNVDFFFFFFNKLDYKFTEKLLWVFSFSIPIGWTF